MRRPRSTASPFPPGPYNVIKAELVILDQVMMHNLLWSSLGPVSERSFLHCPLDISEQRIRLFRVELREDHVLGHMEDFALDTAPSYRALSYTWGQERPVLPIHIDGCIFLIRQNLHQFLVRYSHSHAGQWIWIDQVSLA